MYFSSSVSVNNSYLTYTTSDKFKFGPNAIVQGFIFSNDNGTEALYITGSKIAIDGEYEYKNEMPPATLTVNGNISGSGTFDIAANGGAATDPIVLAKYAGSEKFRVQANGGVGVNTTSGAVPKTLTINGTVSSSNDIYAGNTSSEGIILTSPDGTKYRLKVANGGALSTEAV